MQRIYAIQKKLKQWLTEVAKPQINQRYAVNRQGISLISFQEVLKIRRGKEIFDQFCKLTNEFIATEETLLSERKILSKKAFLKYQPVYNFLIVKHFSDFLTFGYNANRMIKKTAS